MIHLPATEFGKTNACHLSQLQTASSFGGVGQTKMRNTSSRLNYFCKAYLVIACALFFSACEVTFINPLPDSLSVARDERLLGRWKDLDKKEHPAYVRFDSGSDGEFIIHFESDDPDVVLSARTLRIDESSYLVLKDSDTTKRKGYLLAKYVVTGDRMKVWLVDEKKVRQAVRDGKLKGEIGKETYAGVTVTDTPEKILDYLKTAGDGAFEFLVDFEKVADK